MKKQYFLILALLMLGILSTLPAAAQQSPEGEGKEVIKLEMVITKDGETKRISKEFDPSQISDAELTRHLKDIEDFDVKFEDGEMDVLIKRAGEGAGSYAYSFKNGGGNFDVNEFLQKNGYGEEGKEMAYLGIMGQNLIEEEGGHIVVEKLMPGEAAEKAGLKNGDVIQEIDGEKIANMQGLVDFLKTKEPGAMVQVKLARDGKKQMIPVSLGSRKAHAHFSAVWNSNGDDFSMARVYVRCHRISGEERAAVGKKLGMELNDQNQFENLDLKLYPNPTSGDFNYKVNTEAPGRMEMEVYDTAGKLIIHQEQRNESGQYEGMVNLADKPAGEYIVLFKKDGKVATEKMMKR